MSNKLYFDLESVPDQRDGAFERYLERVKPPGNYRKKESIDKWLAENAEAEAEALYRKTSLNGLHSEICSIAWAVNDQDIDAVTRGVDGIKSESQLLTCFWNSLADCVRMELDKLGAAGEARAPFAKLQWIGHNVIDFDLRFLHQRSIINGIRPTYFLPTEARHGAYRRGRLRPILGGCRFRGAIDPLVRVDPIQNPPPTDPPMQDPKQ